MESKGQLSLEYLLLLAAFFSVLLLFVPLISEIYHVGIFGLDARNAKTAAFSIQQTLNDFSLLADGSSKSFKLKPLLEWRISFKGQRMVFSVYSAKLNKEKTFSMSFSSKTVNSTKTISKETEMLLIKKSGTVLIKYL
jgi:hypothetical protein